MMDWIRDCEGWFKWAVGEHVQYENTTVPISRSTAHIFQEVNEDGCVVTEIEIYSLTFPFLLI